MAVRFVPTWLRSQIHIIIQSLQPPGSFSTLVSVKKLLTKIAEIICHVEYIHGLYMETLFLVDRDRLAHGWTGGEMNRECSLLFHRFVGFFMYDSKANPIDFPTLREKFRDFDIVGRLLSYMKYINHTVMKDSAQIISLQRNNDTVRRIQVFA